MNSTELRDLYTEAVRIVRAEHKWRQYVWRDKPEIQRAKIAEMARLLTILATIKDVAKLALYEQPRLLDVPRKVEYK